jgi:peptide/nickel transport system permease protein
VIGAVDAAGVPSRQSLIAALRPAVSRSWGLRIGLALLLMQVTMAVFAPLMAPYSPTDIDPMNAFAAPSAAHPFGTDRYGRDVLSRVIYGGRVALVISLMAITMAIVAGTVIGLTIAQRRGFVDDAVMRVVEIVMSLPSILLLLVVIAAFGTGLLVVVPAVTLLYLPDLVRTIRAAGLDIVPHDYVTAARTRGEGTLAIVRHELWPNARDVVLIEFAMRTSWVVLLISSLSFLGFGVNPPTPDWGLMVNENREMMALAPWGTVFPVLAIATLVIGLNLTADGLAKALGVDRTAAIPQ